MDEARAGEGFVGVLSRDFGFLIIVAVVVVCIVVGRVVRGGAVVGIVVIVATIVGFGVLATIFLLLKKETRVVLNGVEDGVQICRGLFE